MTFDKIQYLEWAKRNQGTAGLDLSNSAVAPLTAEDLGLAPGDLELTGRNAFGLEALLDQVSKRYGVPTKNIVLTHGASNAMYMLGATLLSPGEEVLLEMPNYEPMYRVARMFGAEVKVLDRPFEKGWQVDLEALGRRISRNTRVAILTNLHNPTGVMTGPEKLKTVVQVTRDHGAHLMVNETYLDLAAEPQKSAFLSGDNVIVVGSLTKSYGLGGLRIGWIFCPEELTDRLRAFQSYCVGVNAFVTEKIAVKAFEKLDALREKGRKITQRNLTVFREWMSGRPEMKWVEPDGGTVCFPRLPLGMDSWEMVRLLREKHDTLVTPGDFFWMKGFIRIGLGTDPEKLVVGLERLGQAIDELKKRRGFA